MSIINVLIVLLILIGGILLQIFLSRKDNRIFGLILPLLAFLYSVLAVLNVAVFDSMSAWEVFSALAMVFVMSNIPTIILLAIYFACRQKIKRKKQLDKMNIQDLD